MTGDGALVNPLTDPHAANPAYAGGKGAALAAPGPHRPAGARRVRRQSAYRRFVDEHALSALIDQVTGQLDTAPAGLDTASARLRRGFEEAPVPAPVQAAVAAAYAALGEGPVAVRSSATAEDLPEASCAGQQESVLNVVGAEDLCTAVRRCWSSLWTAKALAYRRRRGTTGSSRWPSWCRTWCRRTSPGVLFTGDPMSGRRDRMVIEAVAGLGEALVGGRVTPRRGFRHLRPRTALPASAPKTHPSRPQPPHRLPQPATSTPPPRRKTPKPDNAEPADAERAPRTPAASRQRRRSAWTSALTPSDVTVSRHLDVASPGS